MTLTNNKTLLECLLICQQHQVDIRLSFEIGEFSIRTCRTHVATQSTPVSPPPITITFLSRASMTSSLRYPGGEMKDKCVTTKWYKVTLSSKYHFCYEKY